MEHADIKIGSGYCVGIDEYVIVTAKTRDTVRAIRAVELDPGDLDSRIDLIQSIIDMDVVVVDTSIGKYILFMHEEGPVDPSSLRPFSTTCENLLRISDQGFKHLTVIFCMNLLDNDLPW